MNFLSTFLANFNDYLGQTILSYVIIALIVLSVIIIVLVNHNIIMKKDCKFRRIITHPLFYYSLKRIGSSLISIFFALAITFCLIRMQDLRGIYCPTGPGTIAGKLEGEAQQRYCDAVMNSLGLSGSLLEQFFRYLYNIIPIPKEVCVSVLETGECAGEGLQFHVIYLGYSVKDNSMGTIADSIFARLPMSFRWSSIATIIQLAIGYPLGVLMAKYQDRLIDKIGKVYIIFIDAIPGLLYIYLLYSFFYSTQGNGLFPVRFDPNNVQTWLAPAITSAFSGIAGIAYWVRRYMLNEINSDYVKFARAKGLSENRIMFTHVLRNAVVPLSRGLSTAFISCLFGSFFIEGLFIIDGFGSMLITAINTNDFMVVQGVVVFSSIISVVSYLIADIAMACCDPRISYTS